MTQKSNDIDNLAINTIRMLSADAIQKANSGHPGMPMACAPLAYLLWTKFMKYNPSNPLWRNRDRFILSAGHGSMLLYSMLHLTGYDLSLDDIKNFRQLNSKTPGHPEFGHTPGVETTTGPLGQGFATGIGMAIAEKFLAAHFNRPEFDIINHKIYAIVSDGDLMEGIAAEAASIAGHLKLGNIIYIYDDNKISIDGSTDLTFTEDRGKRFAAYNWHVQYVHDGNNLTEIESAIRNAQSVTDRPSIIMLNTIIGFGSPNKQGTAKVHGSPLGIEELKLTKNNIGWQNEQMFHIPDNVSHKFLEAIPRGTQLEADWNKLFDAYTEKYPELAKEFLAWYSGELPLGWDDDLPQFAPDIKGQATRKSSNIIINHLSKKISNLIGGSADLTDSTLNWMDNSANFQPAHYANRNLYFGVREHAMAAICNGLALNGALIPFAATFLVFSDYARPAIRLSALMEQRVIYIMTHDGIGLGEDGPTHQPVEHYMALRAIPKLWFIRPADANETAYAWKAALLHNHGPTILALSRQNLPIIDRTKYASAAGLLQGGYILADNSIAKPDIILIATGSEVQYTIAAYEKLKENNISVRVVSMPCWELFDLQPKEYRDKVLPPNCKKRLAIETGISLGWEKYIGSEGDMIALDRFGASAPFEHILQNFGFTTENLIQRALKLL